MVIATVEKIPAKSEFVLVSTARKQSLMDRAILCLGVLLIESVVEFLSYNLRLIYKSKCPDDRSIFMSIDHYDEP